MALTEIDLAKIKVDFESGKLSKRKVAQKHSISRNTLDKHAKLNRWIFATNEQELSQKIEQLTLDNLVKDEVDRATLITNKFLGNIDTYRELAMMPASELVKAYNKAKEDSTDEKQVTVSKDEFSRIWESTKAIKTAIEALNVGYSGTRKALGMDKDEDVRKAKEIRQSEKAQDVVDPLEGVSEEDLDKEIEKLS